MKKINIKKISLIILFFTIAIIISFFIFNIFQNNKSNTSKITKYKYPAEFEMQEAIHIIFPNINSHKNGYVIQNVTKTIIENIVKYQKVKLYVSNKDYKIQVKKFLGLDIINNPNFSIYTIPYDGFWTRDIGPTFVKDPKNRIRIVNFNFNSWGYTNTDNFNTQLDANFDSLIAIRFKIPSIKSPLITEGGDRETDGKGTLMLVETVEFGRNPTYTKYQIEEEYKRVLGIKQFIWLKKGVKEDDHTFLGPININKKEKAYTLLTTNGHVDEFARFVNDSTILLAETSNNYYKDSVEIENFKRLEENFKILNNARQLNGRPYKIIRMPMPKLLIDKMNSKDYVYNVIKNFEYKSNIKFPQGKPIKVVVAASYLNFLITNKVIIGQKYYKKGRDISLKQTDKIAENKLKELFPNREIIMLDAYAVNLGGGGIHCITMHEPK